MDVAILCRRLKFCEGGGILLGMAPFFQRPRLIARYGVSRRSEPKLTY